MRVAGACSLWAVLSPDGGAQAEGCEIEPRDARLVEATAHAPVDCHTPTVEVVELPALYFCDAGSVWGVHVEDDPVEAGGPRAFVAGVGPENRQAAALVVSEVVRPGGGQRSDRHWG
jgi:hypothetical protein